MAWEAGGQEMSEDRERYGSGLGRRCRGNEDDRESLLPSRTHGDLLGFAILSRRGLGLILTLNKRPVSWAGVAIPSPSVRERGWYMVSVWRHLGPEAVRVLVLPNLKAIDATVLQPLSERGRSEGSGCGGGAPLDFEMLVGGGIIKHHKGHHGSGRPRPGRAQRRQRRHVRGRAGPVPGAYYHRDESRPWATIC